MPKPKKSLAPAFVVSISLLTLPLACGDDGNAGTGASLGSAGQSGSGGNSGGTGGGNSGGGTGVQPVECPATRPVAGTPCAAAVSCFGYANGTSCPGGSSCVNGIWVDQTASCNPPPPSCPDTVPAAGGSCPRELQQCDYDAASGCNGSARLCISGKWTVARPGTCNPPAPCPAEEPKEGAACGPIALGLASCTFTAGSCTRDYTCNGQSWLLKNDSCGGGGAGGGSGGAASGGAAGMGAGGAAPFEPCPMTPPDAGSPCNTAGFVGRTCTSIGDNCEITSRCDDDAWVRVKDSCTSPSP